MQQVFSNPFMEVMLYNYSGSDYVTINFTGTNNLVIIRYYKKQVRPFFC
jgi:hypothetical protein